MEVKSCIIIRQLMATYKTINITIQSNNSLSVPRFFTFLPHSSASPFSSSASRCTVKNIALCFPFPTFLSLVFHRPPLTQTVHLLLLVCFMLKERKRSTLYPPVSHYPSAYKRSHPQFIHPFLALPILAPFQFSPVLLLRTKDKFPQKIKTSSCFTAPKTRRSDQLPFVASLFFFFLFLQFSRLLTTS